CGHSCGAQCIEVVGRWRPDVGRLAARHDLLAGTAAATSATSATSATETTARPARGGQADAGSRVDQARMDGVTGSIDLDRGRRNRDAGADRRDAAVLDDDRTL